MALPLLSLAPASMVLPGSLLLALAAGAQQGAQEIERAWREHLEEAALPLEEAGDLDLLVERLARARVVLLGESTHGTHEYYLWRKRITLRLVEEHGFRIVAVEGDWPACFEVDRYVKGLPGAAEDARGALAAFSRWPRWMWANTVVAELVEGLARANEGLPEEERVGFYGLDLQSMPDSMEAVLAHLEEADPEAAERARRAYACLLRHREDIHGYPRALARGEQRSCAEETERVLAKVRRLALHVDGDDPAARRAHFSAKTNALSVVHGERQLRAMLGRGPEGWNLRVRHMEETLTRLLEHRGPDARAVVWAHNTHVGDAGATAMGAQGQGNIGQLARRRFGRDQVFAVGFATHRGTVVAGSAWGAPPRVLTMPPAPPGSFEHVFQQLRRPSWLVLFEDPAGLPEALRRPMGQRAVGVVYDPEHDRARNYVPTILPLRYDALLWFEETSALAELP